MKKVLLACAITCGLGLLAHAQAPAPGAAQPPPAAAPATPAATAITDADLKAVGSRCGTASSGTVYSTGGSVRNHATTALRSCGVICA